MHHRRPLLALMAAAIVVPLSGLAATSASAESPVTLRDPIKREIAQEIVSTAENSTLDWEKQYSYIEDIHDGRGFTGGIIGFTSGTNDMLKLVENYTEAHPNNGLARWIPELKDVDNSDDTGPLGKAYVKAWKKESKKPEFQQAQRDLADEMYFEPSVKLAIEDKLGPLGQFIYYDAAVMHGFEGMQKIRKTAMKKEKTPQKGGEETDYLKAFLKKRVSEMKTEAAHEDTSRIEDAQLAWVEKGNLNLDTPLKWSVYGDDYSIDSNPTPHWTTDKKD